MPNGNQRIQAEAEPMDEPQEMSLPGELLSKGKALQKTGTPYVTAMAVQKPRDLGRIIAAMENEAQFAGEAFYYNLPFGGGIEGPSVGLAMSLAREWGNCAVTMDIEESDEAFIFKGRFIDLQTGYQLERHFRQRKNPKLGKFEAERTQDISFQIGQSKCIRNVILNAMPRWLQDQLVEKAKAAVVAKITPEMLLKERQRIAGEFAAKRVPIEKLVEKIGRGLPEWTALDIASLRGDYSALVKGEMTIEELFPSKGEGKAPEGPLSGKTISDAILKDPAVQAAEDEKLRARQKELDAAKAAQGGAPSPEEQERIQKKTEFESYALVCAKCPPLTFGTNDAEEMKKHQAEKHGNGNSKPPAQEKKGGDLFGRK